jgi:hypothetical protein
LRLWIWMGSFSGRSFGKFTSKVIFCDTLTCKSVLDSYIPRKMSFTLKVPDLVLWGMKNISGLLSSILMSWSLSFGFFDRNDRKILIFSLAAMFGPKLMVTCAGPIRLWL